MNKYTISILFESTWSSLCMQNNVCFQTGYPNASQTNNNIQNSHDWWVRVPVFSWLDAQTNRAMFQWSQSVFRERNPQIACFPLSLHKIGKIFQHWKNDTYIPSLLSSLPFNHHGSIVFQRRDIIFMHIISGDYGAHHLLLRTQPSCEQRNNLLAYRVEISIPLKVHVLLL